MPTEVAAIFAAYPTAIRNKLKEVRRLIFEVAKTTEGIAPLKETLKWGEPGLSAGQTPDRQHHPARLEALGAGTLRHLFPLPDHVDRYIPHAVRR